MDSAQTLVRDHIPLDGDPSERHARASERHTRAVAPEAGAGSLLHGRYRLCERLGAGGFGVVWRAEDLQLRREVALKRVPHLHHIDAGVDPDALERARREALATARLTHPAIVALYEAFVDEDAFHLVSELVRGDTLASLIAADALGEEELLDIGLTLTEALAHAHARGVVHRDVKPHNVLVPHDRDTTRQTRQPPAKLADFGGAHMADDQALTRPGDTLGTLAYMAPEQSEGRQAGPAADLYSLALVLYEGLTGANPVRGPTPAATARRIGRPLPSLAGARPDLPSGLTHAIDTALLPDPARRGTLRDLHDALERALAGGLAHGIAPAHGLAFAYGPASAHGSASAYGPAPTHGRVSTHGPASIGSSPELPLVASSPELDPNPAQIESAAQPRRALPLPRALWLGGVLAAAVWLVVGGLPGVALLLVAGAVPLFALGPRPGVGWLTAALAPLLGLAGLAGAWPALAGQARRWRERAMLGALGYWWLILASPLLLAARGGSGSGLWLAPAAGLPAREQWERSLGSAAAHVLGPALTTGVLLGAALWAAAAVALPWVVRGRGALLDTLAAVIWSAALLAATPYLDGGLTVLAGTASPVAPRGLVVGAILAAAVAVAARALRGPVAA